MDWDSSGLGKLDSDRSRLVSDKVLHLALSDVAVHEFEHVVTVTLGLSKLHGDGSRLVGDEVLHLALGHVRIHELEHVVAVTIDLRLELHKFLGHGGSGIGNEVLESLFGDVLAIELSDQSGSLGSLFGVDVRSILDGVISVVVGEALVE